MHRKGVITCWSDSVKRELLYRCGGLQGALCRMDVFVYCCTLTCVFLSRISYTYTHSVFTFRLTHTHSVCWGVFKLGRESVLKLSWIGMKGTGSKVLEETVSRLSPLWGHTTLTEWPTKQHVSVQPLNPTWAACVRSTFLVLMSYS